VDWDVRVGPREPAVRRSAEASPRRTAAGHLASLQRTAGNAAVSELLTGVRVQRAPATQPAPPLGALAAESSVGDAGQLASSGDLTGYEAGLWPEIYPTLERGSSGPHVVELQQWLAKRWPAVIVDGAYGPQTAAYVCLLQHNTGLTVDGQVGQQTWDMMDLIDPQPGPDTEGKPGAAKGASSPGPSPAGSSTKGSGPATESAPPGIQRAKIGGRGDKPVLPGEDDAAAPSSPAVLGLGSAGPDVARIQMGLGIAYPGFGVADGAFGEATLAYVLLYQVEHGLAADGLVGPETRKHLDPMVSFGRKMAAAEEIGSFAQDANTAGVVGDYELGRRPMPGAISRDVATLSEKDY
jgi:peptidoglycan hydrolase-like protein with peptidoglycan-binding domain